MVAENGAGLSQQQWQVRTEQLEDVGAVRAVNLAAFPTSEEADLVDALRHDTAWLADLSVVVTNQQDSVVGFALLTRCHIGRQPALALAPCAVLPEYQNAGAGSAAIRFALETARGLDEDYVVVLGHPDYYPRFGFMRASDFGIYLSIEVPDDALMVLSLQESAAVPAGQVEYAAPFGIE